MKMKKALLVVAAIALLAGSVNAGPTPYIGLYVDAHSNCRQDIPVAYVPFSMFVWVLPSDNGMMCAEYMLEMPAWMMNTATVVNPDHSVALGSNFGGISICFGICQLEWTWLYELTMFPMSAGLLDYVNIVAHPEAGAISTANCEPGYPMEEMIVLNNLGLNQDCEEAIANEISSWGAIKGMYSE